MKLKEISYIHAEAYAAGELKHGPLALIDADMPVIVVAPNNELLEKLKSNIEEVRARGGQLYVFADQDAGFVSSDNMHIIEMPHVEEVIAPIFYTVPLQLLAYHVALIKGTEFDAVANVWTCHVIGATIADSDAVTNGEIIPRDHVFIDHYGVTVMDSKASAYGRGGLAMKIIACD